MAEIIMSYSSMRGSDYLLQENKIKAFYFRESMPRTYSISFNPRVEIVHVIAKNFNPVSRAEFNPGVENAPCNRSLSLSS
jgi:hypothetical protein